jgi:hypothetical protein
MCASDIHARPYNAEQHNLIQIMVLSDTTMIPHRSENFVPEHCSADTLLSINQVIR